MDISDIINIVLGCITTGLGIRVFLEAKSSKRREDDKEEMKNYADKGLATGKSWIDQMSLQLEHIDKYTSDRLTSQDDRITVLEKTTRTLNSQLMTENKVDSKLKPLKEDVEETKRELGKVEEKLSNSIKDLRDEFRSHASLAEMNTQQLLSGVSEIKGYLKAKSEAGKDA